MYSTVVFNLNKVDCRSVVGKTHRLTTTCLCCCVFPCFLVCFDVFIHSKTLRGHGILEELKKLEFWNCKILSKYLFFQTFWKSIDRAPRTVVRVNMNKHSITS